MDVTARIDTRVRIISRPDRNDTIVEELNEGDLSMEDADVITYLSCAATATVREAQHAYNEDRWVPVTPKRRKPQKVWDYTYVKRRMRTPGAVTETILFDPDDDDVGQAYRLEAKIMVLAEVPLCDDLCLYDIVRVRNVPHGDMERVSTPCNAGIPSKWRFIMSRRGRWATMPWLRSAGRVCARGSKRRTVP
jgi:hypothetical protein